ncbi:hypothetical protein AT251_05585 [Enterovibrio nigricans]|nr:hypothetical protein [Enterovibrio nigricans]PKF51255.1 hypothetical protein AT251_05585 [Enterovibrio nigricans]
MSGSYDDSIETESILIFKVKNKYNTFVQKSKEFEKKSKNTESRIISLKEQKDLIVKKSTMLKDSLGMTVKYIDSKFELEKIKLQVLDSELQIEEAYSLVRASYFDFIQLTLDLSEQIDNEIKKTKELLAATKSELATVNEKIHSTDIISTVDGTVLSATEGLAKGVFYRTKL